MCYSHQNKAMLPNVNYDTEMVIEWLKSCLYFRPPKKLALGNRPLLPPLSYLSATFREHQVLVIDAFCQHPAASVLSPTRAKIVCLHMLEVAEEGPNGVDVNEGEGRAQPAHRTHNRRTPRMRETPI